MKLPMWATTVTPLSKILAGVFFIVFPIIGFYLGIQYQRAVTSFPSNQPIQKIKLETSPTNPDISPSQTVDLIPLENSLYFGTYQDKEALFITDKAKQTYYENGVAKKGAYIGELATVGGIRYESFD